MTETATTTNLCAECGNPAPVMAALGTEIPMRYCETCSPVVLAREEQADRERAYGRALELAGGTARLRGQTLASHPDPAVRAFGETWLAGYAAGRRCNLWLGGPVGLGKTGLAWGIVRELAVAAVDRFWEIPDFDRPANVAAPAMLLPWADLLVGLKDAFDAERRAAAAGDVADPSRLFERAKAIPVLALDDLGRERPTPWALEKLANLVEARYQRLIPTIVTSNYSTKEIAARLGHENAIDGKRIVDRLTEGAEGFRFEGQSHRRRG